MSKDLEQIKNSLKDLAEKARLKRIAGDASSRDTIIGEVSKEVINTFTPVLGEIVKNSRLSKEDLQSIADSIHIPLPEVNIPPIETPIIPPVEVPTPQVTVNIPPIKIPEIRMPEEMPIRGWVGLMGVSLENPLPVQIRNADGSPASLGGGAIAGGGGGGFRHVIVDNLGDISITAAAGLTDAELRASHLDVVQMSGTIDSVYVTGIANSSFSELQNGDGRIKVSVETGGLGLTDTELRAAHLDVQQVSGAIDSVYITGASGTLAANIVDSTGVGYSGSNPMPITGTVLASDITNSIKATIIDSSGVGYSGSNPVPITGTVIVSSVTASTQATIIDSSGVGYSGSNPVPTYQASQPTTFDIKQLSGSVDSVNINSVNGAAVVVGTGYQDNALRVVEATDSVNSVNIMQTRGSATVVGTGYQDNALRVVHATDAIASVYITGSSGTTAVVGDIAPGSANVNSPPVRVGGVSSQSNPTAIADGNVINFRADDLGRTITRPVQIRDLIKTAYVSITNGTETTLLAGVAGAFLDCISIMLSNNSTAAVSVNVRAVTGGNIVHTIRIPADGTAGWVPQVPWPQDATGNNWTLDGPDETGRTITASALFSQEV